MVGCATGAYQSFLPTFAAMGAGLLLLQLPGPATPGWAAWMRRALVLLAVCVAAALLHTLFDSLCKALLSVQSEYIQQMNRLDLLREDPARIAASTLHEAWRVYTGSPDVYGVALETIALPVGLGNTGTLVQRVRHISRLVPAIAMTGACLLGPLALNLVAGGAGTVPYRAMVGVPYAVWLLAAIALHSPTRFLAGFASVMVAAACFQLLAAHGQYNALRSLTQLHDIALAGEIYTRITESVPAFERQDELPVDIYGAKSYRSPFPRVATSTIGGSFFEWDGGSPERILTYMRLLGYEGMRPVTQPTRTELVRIYETMPVWPAQGAVRVHDGIVLVKLGPEPGAAHR